MERRTKLASGGALDSAGKRAAFALFYAPLHALLIREVVRALPDAAAPLHEIVDLGCGTGPAGAAWALETNAAQVAGIDRSRWAIDEANWSYRQLGVRGRATQGDIARMRLRVQRGTGIVAAYTVNELREDERTRLLPGLIGAGQKGACVLIVEPIARRSQAWWDTWAAAFTAGGGRADEWRFPTVLPPRQRALATAAGLTARELTARTLFLRQH